MASLSVEAAVREVIRLRARNADAELQVDESELQIDESGRLRPRWIDPAAAERSAARGRVEQWLVGTRVPCEIAKVLEFGLFVDFHVPTDNRVETGLIPIAGLRTPLAHNWRNRFTPGMRIDATITSIDEHGKFRLSMVAASTAEPLTPPGGADDDVLIAKAAGGDLDAFRALVERHQHRALALSRALVGAEGLAEEVVVEGFSRVYRDLATVDGLASFSLKLNHTLRELSLARLRLGAEHAKATPEPSAPDPSSESNIPAGIEPEHLSFDISGRQLGGGVAAALKAGAAIRDARWASEEMLSSDDAAKCVNMSKEALNKQRHAGKVLALKADKGGVRYPKWQFEDRVRVHVPSLLFTLAHLDAWGRYLFFTQDEPLLDGITPLQALRTGAADRVLRVARLLASDAADE